MSEQPDKLMAASTRGTVSETGAEHVAAKPRRKWSRYDAAHGARIRMILDGPEKGSWIAYCLDCDWTDDAPMPSMAAGYAAQHHEREADHAAA